MMYVRVKDLELRTGAPPTCGTNSKLDLEKIGDACPASNLRIKASAPVEPLVLRAAAGECIKVTLYNWIDRNGAPDMMTYRTLAPIIPSNPDQPTGSVLNANNIRTSNVVGLHPALVAYDMTQDHGAAVSINEDEKNLVDPAHPVDLSHPRRVDMSGMLATSALRPRRPKKASRANIMSCIRRSNLAASRSCRRTRSSRARKVSSARS